MDNARKARSRLVRALGVLGKVYVESEQGYVSIEIELPKGSVYKLLGKELTWDDEPVELQTETEKR
ncbi:translocase [Bacteroides thetaiotaomicron]|nr:translocase [Bacteroides thetaiotaomicron]